MSRNGHIDLDFAGEARRFRLAIGDLEELQEATGVGPFALLGRLLASEGYTFADLTAVIRCGLTGGGMPPGEAHALARRLPSFPLPEVVLTAGMVISAALEQPEDEPLRPRGSKEADEPDDSKGLIRFAGYAEAAGGLGIPLSEVRAMSLWQFVAVCNGFRKAHDPKAQGEITSEEEDALAEMIGLDGANGEA